MSLGYRSCKVIMVIAAQPGACNREVADAAEVSDQGQISKLLPRLENLGLIHNPVARRLGKAHAWRLTTRGKRIERAASGMSARARRRGTRWPAE
jgi:hypothetical protein